MTVRAVLRHGMVGPTPIKPTGARQRDAMFQGALPPLLARLHRDFFQTEKSLCALRCLATGRVGR
jgi:hypothetical protein